MALVPMKLPSAHSGMDSLMMSPTLSLVRSSTAFSCVDRGTWLYRYLLLGFVLPIPYTPGKGEVTKFLYFFQKRSNIKHLQRISKYFVTITLLRVFNLKGGKANELTPLTDYEIPRLLLVSRGYTKQEGKHHEP
jgi:hypothetical protein